MAFVIMSYKKIINNFEVIKTPIKDLVVIQPKVFGDERGFFLETYNKKSFEELGLTMEFVQDNHSKSKKGVLRGLHFQTKNTQGKLVRVAKGSVYDVAVDLRKGSETFGKWYGILLTENNKTMFYVPEGFAHGFLTLEDGTEFMYKCTGICIRQNMIVESCGMIKLLELTGNLRNLGLIPVSLQFLIRILSIGISIEIKNILKNIKK